jgi:hypothetical protein
MTKIEVGDSERAKRMFELLEPTPLFHTVEGLDFTEQDVYAFLCELIDQLADGDWKPIPYIPPGYEINREGVIRNIDTKQVVGPEYDIDYNCYVVKLYLNNQDYWVRGPRLAEDLFKKPESVFTLKEGPNGLHPEALG